VAESEKEPKVRRGAAKKAASPKSRTGNDDGPDSREVAATAGTAPGPTGAELLARGLTARLPWAGASVPFTEPTVTAARAAAAAVTPPAPPDLARAPIDRSVPPTVFTIDQSVRNPDTGEVLLILRRPYGFPSGALPADAAALQPVFEAGGGVCHVLAPGAALRCAAWGRYG
jgi:hypothetical protein